MMLDWKAGLCCISWSMVCLLVKPDRERRAEQEEPHLGQGSHELHLQTFPAKGIYPKEKKRSQYCQACFIQGSEQKEIRGAFLKALVSALGLF